MKNKKNFFDNLIQFIQKNWISIYQSEAVLGEDIFKCGSTSRILHRLFTMSSFSFENDIRYFIDRSLMAPSQPQPQSQSQPQQQQQQQQQPQSLEIPNFETLLLNNTTFFEKYDINYSIKIQVENTLYTLKFPDHSCIFFKYIDSKNKPHYYLLQSFYYAYTFAGKNGCTQIII